MLFVVLWWTVETVAGPWPVIILCVIWVSGIGWGHCPGSNRAPCAFYFDLGRSEKKRRPGLYIENLGFDFGPFLKVAVAP